MTTKTHLLGALRELMAVMAAALLFAILRPVRRYLQDHLQRRAERAERRAEIDAEVDRLENEIAIALAAPRAGGVYPPRSAGRSGSGSRAER